MVIVAVTNNEDTGQAHLATKKQFKKTSCSLRRFLFI